MKAVSHLSQIEVAKRFGMSMRTLERWRWEGIGPKYIKVGSLVRYPLKYIEEFEEQNLKGE